MKISAPFDDAGFYGIECIVEHALGILRLTVSADDYERECEGEFESFHAGVLVGKILRSC